MEDNSPGFELINYGFFFKLPTSFQKELIRKFDSKNQKINQIFDGYNEVLKTLKRTRSKKIKEKNHNTQHQNGFKSQQGNFNKNHTFQKSASILENFSTKASKTVTHCKPCSINEHVMGQCAKYSSPNLQAPDNKKTFEKSTSRWSLVPKTFEIVST